VVVEEVAEAAVASEVAVAVVAAEDSMLAHQALSFLLVSSCTELKENTFSAKDLSQTKSQRPEECILKTNQRLV